MMMMRMKLSQRYGGWASRLLQDLRSKTELKTPKPEKGVTMLMQRLERPSRSSHRSWDWPASAPRAGWSLEKASVAAVLFR
jgi:hypothetical protein